MTFVLTNQASDSLACVLPEVAQALGKPEVFREYEPSWRLRPSLSYLVYLIDGLGWQQLQAHRELAPFLTEQVGRQLSSTVPSTTATSLASFGTARLPGSHGIVGYSSRIPGTNRLLHALSWDKRINPAKWQPHETGFERLARAGVRVTVVNNREYHQSGLSVAAYRGAQYAGADRHGERLSAISAACGEGPSLTYSYENELDWTGHKYGVDSAQWRHALTGIDDLLARTRASLPTEVAMLVIADHGMIDCRGADHLELDQLPDIRQGVSLLGGEARLRHVYCQPGAVSDVQSIWRAQLGDRAEVVTREEAETAGWFGPISDSVAPRIGDLVVAATGNVGLFSSKDFRVETSLIGLHGSLTSAELAIPLIQA